ncbi:MAG: SUMF1/EgtB/PvdO family nonheme iron enzyme [bacterium]
MKTFLVALCLGILYCAASFAAEMPSSKTFTNSIGMDFARIESGTFNMGAENTPFPSSVVNEAQQKTGDYDERPTRRVTISHPFYMGVYEVTNRQYEQFDPDHGDLRGKLGFSKEDDEAVVFVDWFETTRFCEWLSEREGLPYRLPTEAEWEYACRAGTETLFSEGNTLTNPAVLQNAQESWYPDPRRDSPTSVVSVKVGQTSPNPWGLYDMHGNVEEWCHDWYGPYEADDLVDPIGRVDGLFRVTRGGSHSTELYYLRSANRMANIPEDKHWLIGFRVALGALPDTEPLPVPTPECHQRNVSQEIPPNLTKGPDPNMPYFKGPRKYVKIPAGSDGPMFSHHNHDPALVECPNGDLLAIWYTCIRERGRELGALASRLRYGAEEWEEAAPFWDVPDRNDHAPALWFDGDRTLYHFEGLSAAATWGNLATILRTSTDSGATWSQPRIIIPDHGTRHMPIESVFRTRGGTIVLPCDAVSVGAGGTAIHLSCDNGETWHDAGGTIAGIHAGVVELSDGRLLALGRGDNIDDKMPMSISSDMGKTWTYKASPFQPIGSGQRLALIRLKGGPLFLASFANNPVTITDASGGQRSITGLYAALSFDDGETWTIHRPISDDGPGRAVETMDGTPFTMGFSTAEPRGYLSVCQTPDGVIHLISSRQHYAFNQAWLESDPPDKPAVSEWPEH